MKRFRPFHQRGLASLVLIGVASPAAACSLITTISEWFFGTVYLVTVLMILLALLLFRRRKPVWIGAALALTMVMVADLGLGFVAGRPEEAKQIMLIQPDGSEVFLPTCARGGHMPLPEAIWRAVFS